MCSKQNEFYIEHCSSNRNIPKTKKNDNKITDFRRKKIR